MHAQKAREDRVKSAHPQLLCGGLPHKLAYTLTHLTRSLVGKGQGKDVLRRMAAVQQVHNLVCEHTCLARAGAGYNKLGAAEILYGGALGIVKLLQI